MKVLRTGAWICGLGLAVFGAFTLPLGPKTLAEHIDAIGETPAAKDLLDGTRETVNPALQEARDRVLGEYVEAPTHLVGETEEEVRPLTGAAGRVPEAVVVSTEDHSKIPGRAEYGLPGGPP